MKLDIDGVQAFVLVAELGGFHKAAQKLNLSQTALTRRIQKLEHYLGLRLLDRTTRSVSLTRIGREFLPRAARVVDDLTGSLGRLRDIALDASGDVVIACVPSMAYQQLPHVIRAYAARHPRNRVRLLDRSSTQVAEAVRSGEAEIGIGLKLGTNPDLVEAVMLRDPFVLYCRSDHAASRRDEIGWKDLRDFDLVAISGASGNRALLDHQLRRHGIDLHGRFEVEHPSTAISLVAAGVGVRRVELKQPVLQRTLVRFMRRGVTLSPAAQAFHDMLAETLADASASKARRRDKRAAQGASGE